MSATAENKMELAVIVKGEIVTSNFDEFSEMVKSQIAMVNTDLETDEDFGQAEIDIKRLTAFEKTLTDKEQDVLSQMDQVYKLVSGLAELKDISRNKRLDLNNLVTEQKKVIRIRIKRDAVASISLDHPDAEQRIEAAMKGKRNLETLRDSAEQEADAIEQEITDARVVLASYTSKHGDSIAYDEPKLLVMGKELLTSELERRVERQRAEAEKARLKAEAEQARKEAEAAKAATETPAMPEPLPEPPKVGAIPVKNTPEPETAAEEMKRYIAMVEECFAPARTARDNLKHPENIEAAQVFAKTLGKAWSTLKCAQQ